MITNAFNSFSSPRFMPQVQGLRHDHIQHHQRDVKPVDDQGHELKQISPHKIVERKLIDSLEKTLNSSGLSLTGLDAEDFTPKKVAGRILSFAEKVLQQNPEAKDEIKKGLEKGFHDARKILKGMGVFNGELKKDVEKTQQLVEKGLDQLFFHNKPSKVASSMQFQAVSSSSSQSTAIEIETREGDKVTIDFSHSFSSSQSALKIQSDHGSISAFQQHSSMSSQLNVSVTGDLNDEESQAISDLMQQINDISNTFYNGDLNAAFKQAQNVGFDMQQLSGFSLDLNLQQKVEAVAIYQEVSQLAEYDDDFAEEDVVSLIPQAVNFLQQAKAMLEDSTSVLNNFASPRNVLTDLFSGIGQSLLRENSDIDEVEDDDLMAELVEYLADSAIDEKSVILQS